MSGPARGRPPGSRIDDGASLHESGIARIAKGLAHPTRVAIVEQLADGRPRIAQDVVNRSGLAQSTVSEHLRVLRDAGLLQAQRDGPRIWYRLDAAALRRFTARLDRVGDV